MINYTNSVFTGNQQVTLRKRSKRIVTPGRVVAVGMYATAGGIGFASAGAPGAVVGLMSVPEVITIPLIIA